MSTAALAPQPVVIADRLISRSLVTDITLVLTGAVTVGALAQVGFGYPVPWTGQTLAVLLVGGSLGMRRGAMSLFTYLVLGVAGVPWFSNFGGGPGYLLMPSFGYIIGFVFAAGLIGWLAERSWDRKPLLAMAGMVLASLVPFLFGVPYLAMIMGYGNLSVALGAGFTPFILGGLFKCAIAAAIFPAAWAAVRKLDQR